jgi:ABC-type Fe3+/spermidine/putrescine transport system ATPase subunit
MTVFENVAYALKVKKVSSEEIQKRVGETLNLLNLARLSKRRPDEMSGGQQQRVALARALVSQPKIMLFDEPLSNLDAKLRAQMRIELKHLQKKVGLTALYVTHDQEESMALSDTVIIMNQGKIEQMDSPEQIYFSPKSRFVADFIGKANFVPVEVQKKGDRYTVKAWNQSLEQVQGVKEISTSAELLIRPEGIKISSNGSAPFEGVITHSSFLGNVTICEIDVGGKRIVSEVPTETAQGHYEVGQKVKFQLDPKRLFVLPAKA